MITYGCVEVGSRFKVITDIRHSIYLMILWDSLHFHRIVGYYHVGL